MIRLSPSSLNRYFEMGCPASWNFDRQFEVLEGDTEAMDRGTRVHAMMAGELDPAEVADTKDLMFYHKLQHLMTAYRFEVVQTEMWDSFTIAPGVKWVRRIDALVRTVHGDVAVVDFKTTGSVWKSIEGKRGKELTPQAMGFQAIGYTIPHAKQKKWPRTVYFLVAGFRGEGKLVRYDYNRADHDNLLAAIGLVKEQIAKERFPKVRSSWCLECPFVKPCFGRTDWKGELRKK
jgi:hypothetical protein